MSHNINEGRMMYVGEKPWHGIGTELKNPATAKEAIEAARLDYNVELQPIFMKNGRTIPGMVSVRTDSHTPLGLVTKSYKIIQNVEAFDFFDNVVGEKKAIYHTAGALGLGERIWILAKLPKNMIIKKEEIEKYLILTNSHDGKSALKMYFSPIRVVCQNTLILSLMKASSGISIRHKGNIQAKVEEAQRVLGIATLFYGDFERIAEQFTDVKMDTKKVTDYFNRVLDIDVEKEKEEELSTRSENQRNDLLSLFEKGKGNDNPLIRHSLWAAYNAVTEYADHFRTVKGLKVDKTARLDSIWFGSGAKFKERGYEVALEVAGISKN